MSIIWWTLYILGAVTIIIVWLNLITLFIKGCTAILKKEWGKGTLTRKDIESLVRMEVKACVSRLEVCREASFGPGQDKIKFQLKEDK